MAQKPVLMKQMGSEEPTYYVKIFKEDGTSELLEMDPPTNEQEKDGLDDFTQAAKHPRREIAAPDEPGKLHFLNHLTDTIREKILANEYVEFSHYWKSVVLLRKCPKRHYKK